MKKRYFLCFPFFFAVFCCLRSQSAFLPGYYVDGAGVRHSVELRLNPNQDNPTLLTVRDSQTGTKRELSRDAVTTFGLADGSLRYERFVVDIDRSSTQASDVSTSVKPVFVKDTVFLRVLVTGPAILYYWREGNYEQFFYRTDRERPEPLIFRRYRDAAGRVRTDLGFRQQLGEAFICPGLPDPATVAYRKDELIDYLVAYGACKEQSAKVYVPPKRRHPIRFGVRFGLERLRGNRQFGISGLFDETFAPEIAPRFGIFAERLLPALNERFSVGAGVEYRTQSISSSTNGISHTLDYASLVYPFSLRAYFPMGQRVKVYALGSIFIETILGEGTLTRAAVGGASQQTLLENSWAGYEVGLGVQFGIRLSAELRFQPTRQLLLLELVNQVRISHFTLTAGYRFGGLSTQ
ncbi:MAG: hypothetical protein AAFN92_09195 [Bacteroidota bacterium]